MVTSKIRCFVVRIPDADSAVPPRAAWREALPWADPYILGLIRKLQDEVRMERAARFMPEREAAEMADGADWDADWDVDWDVEYDGLFIEPEMASPKHVPATAVAVDGAPPGNVVTAEPTAEDEGEWDPRSPSQGRIRRPR